jgi:hypothetical protein
LLKYIKQRGEHDCGIAAIAMACHVSYERVEVDLAHCLTDGGLNDTLVKDWLRRHDWAWQEVSRNLWKGNKFVPVHPWPPAPFASTHICFVEATRDWHYCVMDFEGRVYDPWNENRQTLDHPDYKRIASVLGLFRLKNRTEAS